LTLDNIGVGRNEDDGAGFLAMLAADPEVAAPLSRAELEALADPQYYLTYVDTAFARLGLL
jgi:adenylosuccinate lyase